jgi:hypothetical protein
VKVLVDFVGVELRGAVCAETASDIIATARAREAAAANTGQTRVLMGS